MAVELRQHQKDALAKIGNGKVLKGGVGSGKTLTSLAYYMQSEAPRDIYVFTTAKKRDDLDWVREAAKYGIGTKPDATTAGVLTIDSWNNIGKYIGVSDAFVIFDEQRLVGSGAWVKSFYKIARANRWILLSATPGDTWMDYIPVFVANGYYKNRTAFIRRHVVYDNFSKFPKVDHYVETGVLERHRRHILVEMPYEKHTKRHERIIKPDHDADLFKRIVKDRWHIFEERPILNVAEMFRVMRQLVNTDPSRQTLVKELMDDHDRLIIFYTFNYELEILREVVKEYGRTCREWNGHKHEEIPDEDQWVYLVQYVAGAEGWNCITTDTILFFSLTYSYKLFEQAKGRIDRLNTPHVDLYYYIFRSASAIDAAIWKSLRSKENFSEKTYAKKSGLEKTA